MIGCRYDTADSPRLPLPGLGLLTTWRNTREEVNDGMMSEVLSFDQLIAIYLGGRARVSYKFVISDDTNTFLPCSVK